MRFCAPERHAPPDPDAVVVVPVLGGEVPSAVGDVVGSSEAADLASAARRLPLAEVGKHAWVAARSSRNYLLVTAGREDGPADPDDIRTSAMVAARTVRARRASCLLALAADDPAAAAGTVVESWLLGAYDFGDYRHSSSPDKANEVVVWGGEENSLEIAAVIGEVANHARDLINAPPGELTPTDLADHCQALGAKHGFTVRTLTGAQLVEGGFAGLVAVGRGSNNAPVLVELERGDPDSPHVALVGKGITFDSGGLSLKASRGMLTMKADMSGAADVLAAVVASARLGLATPVKGYLACAENMPGASALRVGDVLRHRNGLATEVVDTDCEGRLVLSDVLDYAAEREPAQLIDLATLTSSTGLGPEMWAILGTDDRLVEDLLAAGAASGEPGWRLPLWSSYTGHLRSDVADLRNTDPHITQPFGAVLAALYLRSFTRGVPWAHIDLALTVMRETPSDAWRVGSNANGSRTLIRHLLNAG